MSNATNIDSACLPWADYATNSLAKLEDAIALEWYDKLFGDLDEDEQGEVAFEAQDRFNEQHK